MNNTLKNGFRVLELLSLTGESFSVKDISTTLNIPNSHACRLLKTLKGTGYVEQNSSRKYKMSMKNKLIKACSSFSFKRLDACYTCSVGSFF